MTDLRRAAEHLATSPNGREFLAGIIWPVAVRESPDAPEYWIAEQAGLTNSERWNPDVERALDGAVDLQRRAARLLLCRAPRGADDPRHSHNYGLWTADIARIEAATGARTLARLLRACAAPPS